MKLIDIIEVKQQNSAISALRNVIYDAPPQVFTQVSDIRNVVQQTQMMACPIEYFDLDSAIKPEMFDLFENKKEVVESIFNFINYYSENAQVYAMCPIQFYDVERHIKSNVDKDIFCPRYEQAFFAINALMPNLRATERRLTNLENIQKQMIEMAKRSIIIEDPMLFAIPKNSSIYDNPKAVVGVCWGKDISNNVVKNLNLRNVQHNLRKKIIKSYNHLETSQIEIKKQAEFAKLAKINEEIMECKGNQHQIINYFEMAFSVANFYYDKTKRLDFTPEMAKYSSDTQGLNLPFLPTYIRLIRDDYSNLDIQYYMCENEEDGHKKIGKIYQIFKARHLSRCGFDKIQESINQLKQQAKSIKETIEMYQNLQNEEFK